MATITLLGKNKNAQTGNGKAFELAQTAINNKGCYIRPSYDTSKKEGTRSVVDYTGEVISILLFLGYTFEAGNDAPNGGRCGNWIIVK